MEAPVNAKLPFYTVIPMPGTDMEGGLGSPNSIEERIYQIDVVGRSPLQAEEAEKRLCRNMTASLVGDVAGVMGPPLVRKNGASRATNQVYHRVVIARISISEEEE